jgi:pSer/pThr/pTyr-binding forkhead associated (FHA) protein
MDRLTAPRERGPAYLVVLVNGKELQRRPMTGPVTLGRSLDCDIWLDDPRLSRKHCRFELALAGDGWAIVDLGSRNGTFVNGKQIHQATPLNHKDVIEIGDAQIQFRAHGYVPPRPAGPNEAMFNPAHLKQALDGRAPTPHQHIDRPLPTPQVTSFDSTIIQSPGETLAGNHPQARPHSQPDTSAPTPHRRPHTPAHTPLAFTRPPARPIVKPTDQD